MAKQKELSKKNVHHETNMNNQNELLLNFKDTSEFIYDKYKMHSKIIFLMQDNHEVDKITKEGYIILDKTCFYATSGGQVNDTGMIQSSTFKARVLDVFKAPNGQHLHKIKVLSGIVRKEECDLIIDEARRREIEANHSSVHLLQYALRSLISKEIAQNGSRVDENTLRFDFNCPVKLTDEMLIQVEKRVREMIKEKIKRIVTIMDINDVDKNEVMALFGEKYGNKVRLVEFDESKELCGGTHVKNTSDIKNFAILSLVSKGSNVYRIEAATNDKMQDELLLFSKSYNDEIVKLTIKAKSLLAEAKSMGITLTYNVQLPNENLNSYQDIVELKKLLAKVQDEVKTLEKDFNHLKEEKMVSSLSSMEEDIQIIGKTNLLLKKVEKMDNNSLKQVMDNLANQYDNIFILIANVLGDNVSFLARSNSPLMHAGNIVKEASTKSLGNGGGSPTFAQGGGKTTQEIEKIFQKIIKDLENA